MESKNTDQATQDKKESVFKGIKLLKYLYICICATVKKSSCLEKSCSDIKHLR